MHVQHTSDSADCTAAFDLQGALDPQRWSAGQKKECVVVCVRVLWCVCGGWGGSGASPVCIHWSSDSQHNLEGLRGQKDQLLL